MTRPITPRAFLALAVLGTVCAGAVSTSSAHIDYGDGYSHKDSDCRNGSLTDKTKLRRADPITAAFIGHGMRYQQSVIHLLKYRVGWTTNAFDATQYFWDHGDCRARDVEASTSTFYCKCNRWHVRGVYQDHGYGASQAVVMTPNRDVWQSEKGAPGCHSEILDHHIDGKHYVHEAGAHGSGFDRGRAEMIKRLKGELAYKLHQSGHSMTMLQCNKQLAGSDGRVAVFYVDSFRQT